VNDEQLNAKVLDRSSSVLIEALSQKLSDGTGKNMINLTQDV
jgi:hypothetical protein